jgi:RNase adaptor protein for sRNA GlmZ degradation
MTRKHVELFDKIKKRRRILEKLDDSDDDLIDTSDITNEYFTEMFRSHLKRKKLRRKIRNQPPDQVHTIHIRSILQP